ncbi:hypothetical protein LCGC14_2823830 [marine sediment metagenome]|uniref:Uncharacterized protein n=1 Tax=marine sediment metagenome TaxID=412755 RepID=A0A0F8YG95_9ZZZZ
MTDATHKMFLVIQSIAEKHGVDYDIDTESMKMLMNFIKSTRFMGEEGVEMMIIAFLVAYDRGAKNHWRVQGT